MTIGGLIIGGIIICILIYMIASAAGLIKGGSGKTEKPKVQQTQEKEDEKLEVPDIVGKSEDDALKELNAKHLGLKKGGEEASDTVPGKTEKPKVEQTQEKEDEKLEVPDIVGKSEDDALKELNAKHLGLKKGGEEASDTVPEGMIARQEPEAGTKVDKNTKVNYYVSTGKSEEKEEVTIQT